MEVGRDECQKEIRDT